MLASRAVTGMLDVLAMRTVRSMSGRPRARVLEVRELLEHLRHLVSALAAADVDDDVRVGPLGQLVLRNGLARSETAGDDGRAALGYREEEVDDALARHERLARR